MEIEGKLNKIEKKKPVESTHFKYYYSIRKYSYWILSIEPILRIILMKITEL